MKNGNLIKKIHFCINRIKSIRFIFVFLGITSLALMSCSKPSVDESSNTPTAPAAPAAPKYLYVASGLCQAGANTTFTTVTSSNRVYRLDLITGQMERMLADYSGPPAISGDSPIGILPFNNDFFLSVVERAGARRVEKVPFTGSSDRPYLTQDTTLLANTLLSVVPVATGGYYFSRTTTIGKMSSTGITQMATVVGGTPGGACGASNTKYSAVESTLLGHLIFANSVASNNRIGIIQNTGTTCLAGVNAPQVAAFPSAMLRIPGTNQLLVAYAGSTTTADINSIQVYDITETSSSASIGGPTKIYDYASTNSSFALYGISSMAFDSASNSLFVATAISNATTVVNYNIEKFNYDPNTKTLTKPIAGLYKSYSLDTKCISGMFIQ